MAEDMVGVAMVVALRAGGSASGDTDRSGANSNLRFEFRQPFFPHFSVFSLPVDSAVLPTVREARR